MYNLDRIVKATESCKFHDAFASDIKHCENALGMGGLMAINAECWLDILNAMTNAEIADDHTAHYAASRSIRCYCDRNSTKNTME